MNGFHRILQKKFQESQARSTRFSQRAMAKKLGISSGALSEILKAKRAVSPKLAQKLADQLQLSPSERKQAGIAVPSAKTPEFQLSADAFQLISEWWHLAILNLTTTKGFRSDSSWIAGRLGLPRAKVDEAIHRLKRLDLLKEDNRGRLSRTHVRLNTSDNIKDMAIQRAHRMDLELVDEALSRVPVSLSDITSITFSVDTAQLAKLREMIRLFQDELMEEAESVTGGEVYRASFHLFPLTKPVLSGEA
jgi:transcriptional regulator with XRE-family HTH domain